MNKERLLGKIEAYGKMTDRIQELQATNTDQQIGILMALKALQDCFDEDTAEVRAVVEAGGVAL